MSREFSRGAAANRSARIASREELASEPFEWPEMRHKWQSIGAIGNAGNGAGNFERLKKGYATMRKSFRLPAGEAERRAEARTLMGQLGSSAAKLLRGVYVKGRRANAGANSAQPDSIQCQTAGSFRSLAGPLEEARRPARKSEAELKIEQRLERARKRVLPSARYQAPDCENACDGLDLDRLQEIKRDNLRMTLTRAAERERPVEAARAPEGDCSCENVDCNIQSLGVGGPEAAEEEEGRESRASSGRFERIGWELENELKRMFDSLNDLNFKDELEKLCGEERPAGGEPSQPANNVGKDCDEGQEERAAHNCSKLGGVSQEQQVGQLSDGPADHRQPTSDHCEPSSAPLDSCHSEAASERDDPYGEFGIERREELAKFESVARSSRRGRELRRKAVKSMVESVWRDEPARREGSRMSELESHEDHLYASIQGSSQTPSPERGPCEEFGPNSHWCAELNARDTARLFDKQLHSFALEQGQPAERATKHKQSLFGRFKRLITHNGPREAPEWAREPHRNRAATLSAKSAQNLLAASANGRLSMSRKSVNLACYEEPRSSKSLVNGFFTLGRRRGKAKLAEAAGNSGATSFEGRRRSCARSGLGGSLDSLPSADSGLSCNNLQNCCSSDDNYAAIKTTANLYSCAPAAGEPLEASQSRELEEQLAMESVGRARAKIDCNPCAYDKEALVFKKGDVIDILERDDSGTWIGRCGGKVGHFKFINVTEILDEDDALLAPPQKLPAGEQPGQRSQEPDGPSGVYITKLEIKGNNHRQQLAASQMDRRSASMNTINVNRAKAASNRTLESGYLTESSETIMSSLEQLLFAIGLAGAQVERTYWSPEEQSSRALAERQQVGDDARPAASYIDVLSKGGINNLDSFSTIDDWQELEQIGIVDDEHKRRLLMAARIIRQASQAAKLDFVESHKGKSAQQTTAATADNGYGNSNNSANGRNLAKTGASYQARERAKRDGCFNEPIYVNLTNDSDSSLDSHEVAAYRKQKSKPDKSIVIPLVGSNRDQVHLERQSEGEQHQTGDCKCSSSFSETSEKPRRGARWTTSTSSHAVGYVDRITRNSINQSDHYRLRCLDNNAQSGEVGPRAAPDHHYEDQEGSQLSSRQVLNRNYSVRLNASSAGRRISQFVESDNVMSSNHYHTHRSTIAPNMNRTQRPVDQNGRFSTKTTTMNKSFKQSNCMRDFSHDTAYDGPSRQSTNITVGGPREARFRKSNTLRSQINSKSAYDLRLDLSHFFS